MITLTPFFDYNHEGKPYTSWKMAGESGNGVTTPLQAEQLRDLLNRIRKNDLTSDTTDN